MDESKRADRELVKRVNRSLVLNLVKSAGPISRKAVADRSGLSPATVSNLTGELIQAGLVEEVGAGEAARGRPPVLLSLNGSAGYVVGIKVMEDSLVAVVTDLDAEVLISRTAPLSDQESPSPSSVLADVAALVGLCIAEAEIPTERVFGVGLGLAGLIDGVAGVCRYSPFFGWRDVDLAGPLEEMLGLEVFLENDVNALTLAEQWFGHGQGVDHFAVVTVGRGVGAGIVTGGRLHRGTRGAAGELGHLTVSVHGPECECGRTGCLETLAADTAIVNRVRAAIEKGEETVLSEDELSIEVIGEAAERGDALARAALSEAGTWLGVGLAAVANLTAPELMIVAGEGIRAGALRLDAMRTSFEEHTFDRLSEQTRLVIESAGDETWARGAACVVLGELFSSPLYTRSRASQDIFEGALSR